MSLVESTAPRTYGRVPSYGPDYCSICYTDALRDADVVQLLCGHAFHLDCTRKLLEHKFVSHRLTFHFLLCPLCKAPIENPALDPVLAPLKALRDDVRRKAKTRLIFEGLDKSTDIVSPSGRFYNKPAEFAMEHYAYYMCFKCKQPYFGGAAQCEGAVWDHDVKAEELICPACVGPEQVQTCSKHGTDYIAFKCRYCCSYAVYFCFSTTHFCEMCHSNNAVVTTAPPHLCPTGPLGKHLPGGCPLGGKHAPNGVEHAFGCAMCANLSSF
ncbi:E3 ubiquitin-protein ligase MYCBP2-like [Dreissena polymorpha]|uniref:RING-type domain-containing protein n=1 Tax=Dreissena polymorpha TaxID=45954 RepID=A0A9D4KC18_DREPO|nr:E3 ubiquitin-protein ligase MYCBP2-like [Dreissena polymorpha]KAH3836592.1 hypothetical protein DPMN_109964 [Dreissena polymorpha]